MKTLLIVEDDEHQRLLYEQELIEEGYDVVLASNGKEALEKVGKLPIDLVVLDIRMSEMDGIEALGRILGTDNKLPVILHTAYANYKDTFMSWAAEAYVVKSSDLTELKNRIREAFEKQTAQSAGEATESGA